MNWCWIIPIIVGLITALLGYLLGRWSRQRDVEEWHDKYDTEKENHIKTHRKIPLLESDLAKAQESEQKANMAHKELKGRFDLLQHEWDENRTAIQNLKDENTKLAQQLAECRQKVGKQTGGQPSKKSSSEKKPKKGPANITSPIPKKDEPPKLRFDAGAARSVFGKSIKQDDLTIIEGIGPRIQELFLQHGVKTWYELSKCSVDKCQEILNSGGSRFQQHKPETWPRQAKLAFQGKWAKLLKWQNELDGGV